MKETYEKKKMTKINKLVDLFLNFISNPNKYLFVRILLELLDR